MSEANKTARYNQKNKQNCKHIQNPRSFLDPDQQTKDQNTFKQLFSSFIYKDQVTRYRYQFSKLKYTRRLQTCPNQPTSQKNFQAKFFNGQLKVLQAINKNRKKHLVENYKNRSKQKNNSKFNETNIDNYQQIHKLKRKIRQQVLNLNQQFLREYLYHQQPFSKMLLEINKYSDVGIVDQVRINELKSKITKCIEERKQNRRLSKQKNQDKIEGNFFQRKIKRQAKQRKIEKSFQEIWLQLKKQIGSKIKMEGQYNLYNDQLKKIR